MPKPKILIVEDDRSISEVLEYNLQSSGYETIVSMDGQDALNQARLKLPDLVLLDLMIPIIDGLEVCKHLRASEGNARHSNRHVDCKRRRNGRASWLFRRRR